jgi:hypothetical protein
MKPADVCFYFDADILGLAHIICALRSDCTYPGDPGAAIKRRLRPACDLKPKIGDNGWMRFPRKRGGIDNRGRDARETEEVRPGVS